MLGTWKSTIQLGVKNYENIYKTAQEQTNSAPERTAFAA